MTEPADTTDAAAGPDPAEPTFAGEPDPGDSTIDLDDEDLDDDDDWPAWAEPVG